MADRRGTLVRDQAPPAAGAAPAGAAGTAPLIPPGGPRSGRSAARRPRGTPRPRARRPIPGQLPLPFPDLPALPIDPDWKGQPRLWGHAYHPMCSYLASFPASLAHAFVARYTRPGDVVLDPFAGRGTAPLQACAEGRIGVGNDLNPLAHVLTAAKVEPPTARELEARLADLRLAWSFEAAGWLDLAALVAASTPAARAAGRVRAQDRVPGAEPVPAEVALAFHPRTLGQLLFVRSRLRLDDPADRFLAAALAGILHGKRPGYLSELMPNTFSMAPRYVRDFAARSAFASPERDLFALLGAKLRRLARDGRPGRPGSRSSATPVTRGAGSRGAARAGPPRPGPPRPHLAALPAGPQVRLLQLAARLVPGVLRRGDRRRASTTRTGASRTSSFSARSSRGCARRSRTTPWSPSSSATSRPSAASGRRRSRDRPGRRGPGERRATGGLPAGGHRARRDRGAAQDDEAVGRGGRAGDEGRPDPRPRHLRGRPAAGRRTAHPPDRLELAAAPLTEATPGTGPGEAAGDAPGCGVRPGPAPATCGTAAGETPRGS
ncbi:MAG: hypothetical protein MZW92_20420 [Comamonadaceae bacterium]|nr:hypothetical protein [Comamonadaceae bacterium]